MNQDLTSQPCLLSSLPLKFMSFPRQSYNHARKSSQERESTEGPGTIKTLEIRKRRLPGSSFALRNWNVAEFSTFFRIEKQSPFRPKNTNCHKKSDRYFSWWVNTFCLLLRHTFLPASAVQLGLVRNSQSVGSRSPQARNIKGTTQLGGQPDYLHCLRSFFSCLGNNSCQQS